MKRRKKQWIGFGFGFGNDVSVPAAAAPRKYASPSLHHQAAPKDEVSMSALRRQPVWLLLAVASGVCAAFNGVFAKLTTTSLTTTWSHALSSSLSISPTNQVINYLLRAFFFALNLLFNLAMWTLFTAALTRATSTTRVSIINVSSNFMVTALLGLVVFGEKLPPLWWVGAGLLAAGNVVIGRREEGEKPRGAGTVGSEHRDDAQGEEVPLMRDEGLEEADMIDLDVDIAHSESTSKAVKKGGDVDAPLR